NILSLIYLYPSDRYHVIHSFPSRRSSDLPAGRPRQCNGRLDPRRRRNTERGAGLKDSPVLAERLLFHHELPACRLLHMHTRVPRSEEHTSELQSRENLVCRLLLEKKNIKK